MPSARNFLPAEDPRRSTAGLVYSDDTIARGRPACHVLILGVASYQSKKCKSVRTSAISARVLADWFADEKKARFANRDCRLGSLALLLSEEAVTTQSNYAGGAVPRATFANAKAAVRSWLDRINTHKDNLAILYVAGHGESFLNRTAFLLEDYGTDPHDATAGMVEVEQFIGSLENALAVPQLLLFDCCRNPTPAELPWNELVGNKLISLTRRPDEHGEPRKQWVICSTSLGDKAGAVTAGQTFFNMALLESLNGVASDTSADGWPVRPGLLLDKIDRILALHRLPEEKAQTPAGRMAGSFNISFPGEASEVPVYITLSDPAEWPDSTINVKVNGTPVPPVKGAAEESPFRIQLVPEQATLEIEAQRNNSDLGHVTTKARAPAAFVTIEKSLPELLSGRTPIRPLGAPPLPRETVLEISIPTNHSFKSGAVADIVWSGRRDLPAVNIPVDIGSGSPTALKVAPGDVTVTLRTPDGRAQSQDITISPNRRTRVTFEVEQSPHEWLAAAGFSGAIRPPSGRVTGDLNFPHVIYGLVGTQKIESLGSSSTISMSLTGDFDDPRFVRLDINDWIDVRFRPHHSRSAPERQLFPQFARIAHRDRVELVYLPSTGTMGPAYGDWKPFVLIDRDAYPARSITNAIVESKKWSALLGFLATREMIAGSILLERGLEKLAIDAIEDKIGSPLAAVAGALIAVAASRPDAMREWDPWLRNIATWFPTIPDGAIIYGRRLLRLAAAGSAVIDDACITDAARWLIEGFRRGVPVYSLSVDWLARGLESLPEGLAYGGEDIAEMQREARRLANRVDSTLAFTVIREK